MTKSKKTKEQIIEEIRELYEVSDMDDEEVYDFWLNELSIEDEEPSEQELESVSAAFRQLTDAEKRKFLSILNALWKH